MAGPFKSINYEDALPNVHEPFTIACRPNTDVWDKPPSTHSFNAPILYQAMDVASFISAHVSVWADWKEKYDQGGLCLIVDPMSENKKWIKTGIEFLDDRPHVSTVATDRWSDWSLRPMSSPAHTSATVEMKIMQDGSLWVFLVADDGHRSPMREVTWWADLDKSTECWIGVYAAKPANVEDDLVVHFEQLAIEKNRRP